MEIDNGRYRLIRRLGQGGTGVVYQAADLALGRTVAVKGLHRTFSVDVLQREGQSLACVSHPNVVALYDVVEGDGRPYLIMEYVDGCNLEQWLAERGSLPLEQALRIFQQVAGAIVEAHAQGLLHCDLKPANVLISTSGEVKLTDFTLARRLTNGSFDGPIGGSMEYAAPEQLSGTGVSPRTDVYGLGALLDRMIGHPDGASPQVKQVMAVIQQATAVDPAERFARVEDLLAALPLEDVGVAGLTQLATLSRTANLTRVAPAAARAPTAISRFRWPLGVVCAALLLAIGALFTHLTVAASPAPTRVTVPDLVATQSQSAQLVVRSLALRFQIVHAYSSTAPVGMIISQFPTAGTQVAPRGMVQLVVSEGPKPVAIPDLGGLSKEAATRSLQHLGLRVVLQTKNSISHDSGTVLDQSPLPGSQGIPGKTSVIVTVSTKPWWWIF